MTYEITLLGAVIGKKNRLTVNRGGRFTYGGGTHEAMDRLGIQIPPDVRDLQLKHPDLDVTFAVTDGKKDRDNSLTTIIDLLVRYGVIAQDNIAQFNGTITVHPAIKGAANTTWIVLTDRGIDRWPKHKKGRIV